MIAGLLTDKVRLIVTVVIITLIVLFALHYINLRHQYNETLSLLSECKLASDRMSQDYKQLSLLNNQQVQQFNETIKLQSEEIQQFKVNIQSLNLKTSNEVTVYKMQLQSLQSDVSKYKRELLNKQPAINNCDSGFQLIFNELKENATW